MDHWFYLHLLKEDDGTELGCFHYALSRSPLDLFLRHYKPGLDKKFREGHWAAHDSIILCDPKEYAHLALLIGAWTNAGFDGRCEVLKLIIKGMNLAHCRINGGLNIQPLDLPVE